MFNTILKNTAMVSFFIAIVIYFVHSLSVVTVNGNTTMTYSCNVDVTYNENKEVISQVIKGGCGEK